MASFKITLDDTGHVVFPKYRNEPKRDSDLDKLEDVREISRLALVPPIEAKRAITRPWEPVSSIVGPSGVPYALPSTLRSRLFLFAPQPDEMSVPYATAARNAVSSLFDLRVQNAAVPALYRSGIHQIAAAVVRGGITFDGWGERTIKAIAPKNPNPVGGSIDGIVHEAVKLSIIDGISFFMVNIQGESPGVPARAAIQAVPISKVLSVDVNIWGETVFVDVAINGGTVFTYSSNGGTVKAAVYKLDGTQYVRQEEGIISGVSTIPVFPVYSNKTGPWQAIPRFLEQAENHYALINLSSLHDQYAARAQVQDVWVAGEIELGEKATFPHNTIRLLPSKDSKVTTTQSRTDGLENLAQTYRLILNQDQAVMNANGARLDLLNTQSVDGQRTATEVRAEQVSGTNFVAELANSAETALRAALVVIAEFFQESYAEDASVRIRDDRLFSIAEERQSTDGVYEPGAPGGNVTTTEGRS